MWAVASAEHLHDAQQQALHVKRALAADGVSGSCRAALHSGRSTDWLLVSESLQRGAQCSGELRRAPWCAGERKDVEAAAEEA